MTPGRQAVAATLLFCFTALGIACSGSSSERPDASVPTWNLVEELRIGSHDVPGQTLTYSLPFSLALGSHDNLYIAQSQAGEIWQYDPTGRFVRAIGRKGNGPGEFSHLFTIGVLRDTLYAANLSPGRLSFFSLDGMHLSTSTLVLEPRNEYESPTPPHRLLPDGSAVVSPARAAEARITTFLRIDRSGKPLNTLLSHSAPTGVAIPLAGGRMLMRRPLADYPLLAIAEDGSRMAVLERYAAAKPSGAAFQLTELTLSGDTLSATGVPYRPIPVPEQVADSLLADMVHRIMSVTGSRRAAERGLQAALRLPQHYPPVTSILYADDLNVWLAREGLPGSVRQWEVYAGGHRIAQLAIPGRSHVLLVREERLWTVELDEHDVPYVIRYRIQRSPR